jgi:hypothetical protein
MVDQSIENCAWAQRQKAKDRRLNNRRRISVAEYWMLDVEWERMVDLSVFEFRICFFIRISDFGLFILHL